MSRSFVCGLHSRRPLGRMLGVGAVSAWLTMACGSEPGGSLLHGPAGGGALANGVGGGTTGVGGTSSNVRGGTGGNGDSSSSGGSFVAAGTPGAGGGQKLGGSTGLGGSPAAGTSSGGQGTSSGGRAKGGTASGGATSAGGGTGVGGAATGGSVTGGTSTGGRATGATGSGGKSTAGAGTGGTGRGGTGIGGTATGGTSTGGAGTGGSTATGQVFSQCRFHFGTIDSIAKNAGTSMISQLDFFTPGWMLGGSFDQSYVCTEGNSGGALANLVPVVVAYLAAGIVKRNHSLCDCNVSGCSGGDLCQYGAQYIVQDWNTILNAYRSYSQGYAGCYGTTRPIVFEMEPDWYQYTISNQTQPWTAAQAGQYMGQLVAALKTNLPNARFSIDVSPWVAPNNGSDHGAQWFSNFDMSLFTFVNTSGGGTNANNTRIRSSNSMTWAGLNQASGKPILADTGYGANGVSAGHDPNWDVVANINARIADGVVSIAQYNPSSNWGTTISNIRSQLSTPRYCP